MKKMKNKKAAGVILGAVLLIVGVVISLFAGSKIVFAQGGLFTTLVNPIEAVAQIEVEVNVKYIFEDEKVFKEEKIKAEKGWLLDSGDLPIIPDDMKFIDEFLFYEVKGDGKDEIIRKVTKIDVKDKETQTENESSKSEQSSQSNASKIENKGTQTELSKDDIS
ncbi:TPA: cell surface protein, partial [Clostridioides difficile]|nr:cell surface protein [Clostridioides difficile]